MNTHSDEGSAVDRAIGGRISWWMHHPDGRRRTQAELAAYLHMDQSAISKKLRGERPFTVRELYAVAEFLGRSVREIAVEPEELGEPPVVLPRRRRLVSISQVHSPTNGEYMRPRIGRSPIPAGHKLNRYRYRFTGNQLADVAASLAS